MKIGIDKKPGHDMETIFDDIKSALGRYHTFVLTTHREPDGDGLGAEAALVEALTQLGKVVHVVNNDPVPGHYQFLQASETFQTYEETKHVDLISKSDAVILLDAARPERTGRPAEALARYSGTTISIDHHLDGGWAQLDLIEPAACATTELVHELIKRLPVRLTPTMSEALYSGIVADTQCFRTAHTTPAVHLRAADLIEAGASIERVHRSLFASWPLKRQQLLGSLLSDLHIDAGGRLVWGAISQKDLHRHNATSADVEGLIEEAFTVAGTELAVLFIEEPGGTTRISFRSRKGVKVDGLAKSLGGGGHAQAAGARITGPLTTVVQRTLRKAHQVLEDGKR